MKKLQYCFWLVLIAHLLLFLSFTVVLMQSQPEDTPLPPPEEDAENSGHKPVPAYVYQEPQQPMIAAEKPQSEVDTAGILKPQEKTPPQQKINTQSAEKTKPSPPEKTPLGKDPTNLFADKQTDKPLIKLLSRATGKKLVYPKSAQDFRVTGKASVRFYLTPDGVVSDVMLVGSSGSSVLDDAALTAVAAISPVRGVKVYLPEARYLVVGIIFSA
jgi:TonB family protein